MRSYDYDWIIVGSGFGGSVSALRLVEKGYRVLLLEKGGFKRAEDFPVTNWNLKRWMWLPQLGYRGFFKMTFLRHLTVLSGVGVGGGSLVYANTLPMPRDDFFSAASWVGLADWKKELSPHYSTARRMLGVTENPLLTSADDALRQVARDMGREQHFAPSQVGVFFGEPGVEVADPYFGGEGPPRRGCNSCGGCMVGCRYGAKNTLDRNYLYLAQRRGLRIEADSEVTWVSPLEGEGFRVTARQGAARWLRRNAQRDFTARRVVFAGGVLGTVPLLLKLRAAADGLPNLSSTLGAFVRTNSEVLMGVVSRQSEDRSRGIAIGSIFHTDDRSHLEPVRYPKGSGFFRVMALPHASGERLASRVANSVKELARRPLAFMRAWATPDWAAHTIILLYMRTLDGHLRLSLKGGGDEHERGWLASELTDGPAPSASIPEADELAERIADKVEGVPQSLLTETLLGSPTTAHILGGCCMGSSAQEGVIDVDHQIFGYDGLYVVDGSAVSANPGVNPSLTITALAERAMSRIPARG